MTTSQVRGPGGAAGYALELSEAEIDRYRLMAEGVRATEAELWRLAGVGPGARVADIGCGPGALLRAYAAEVGPGGSVTGVDGDPAAVAAAAAYTADLSTVEVVSGSAADTGLPAESFDAVLVRHLLAHNGGAEQAIVGHLAGLLRPGGCLYLVDVDSTAMRVRPLVEPDLEQMHEMYRAFQAARGNDLQVGLRLADLLRGAGLDVVEYRGQYVIRAMPPGLRLPPWAARKAMLAAGVVTAQDITRWERALRRLDAAPTRPTMFAATFVAIGRRAG